MSVFFGPIVQIGYVVRDIDAAMEHWARGAGVGPFVFKANVTFPHITYRGEPAHIETAVAHAFSGDLDVELIQQTNDAPSIYTDFLAEFGEGMQHLGVLVEDWDAQMARAAGLGWSALQAGTTHEGVRFAYFDNAGTHPGTMIEFIERTPAFEAFFDRTRKAAAEWDGQAIRIAR